jgi:voltage-gated potassium channel
MAMLALAVIPALLLEDGAATPRIQAAATVVNWVVWLAFCGEFFLRLSAAPHRMEFLRRSWVDVAIIAVSPPFGVPNFLQSLRSLRAIRLLKLIRALAFLNIGLRSSKRALRHRRFHYVLLVATSVMLLGAFGLWILERGQNDAIVSFADALWWAVTTTTTVGYGDIYPRTGEGRLIAVVLMLTGIGLIGVFTAMIASFFMAHDEHDHPIDVERRLDAIEAKLDQLLVSRASTTQ